MGVGLLSISRHLLVLFSIVGASVAAAAEPAPNPNVEVIGTPSKTEPARVARQAIDLLDRVASGKRSLLRAEQFWKESSKEGLLHHLAYGPVSRTDAVLTRHYSPETGKEVRERYVTVILKKDQSLADVAMDLAHELTHATTPPTWDPYDPALTAGKYMHAALEASGGEIDAVFAECEVAVDFKQDLDIRSTRCDRYLVLSGDENRLAVDRSKIRSDFYRVGRWESFVKTKLGADTSLFPLLSSKAPELYSATGGAPYPVALMREYEELNHVACENVRRRTEGRSPASASEGDGASLGDRCRENRPSKVGSRAASMTTATSMTGTASHPRLAPGTR